MSITVVTARDEYGAPSTREVYEDGAKFVNDNGNLDILSAKPQLIATYGSGNWMSVHLGDAVTVITKAPDETSDDSSDSDFDFDSDSSDDSDTSSDDTDTSSDDTDASSDDTDASSDDAETSTQV